jgi:AcrR family transcriptional regulator
MSAPESRAAAPQSEADEAMTANASQESRPQAPEEAQAAATLAGLETRERILQAARQVFAERGFVEATIEDIVALCEVSRGTFYYYFKNKGDVFEALVRMAVGELLGHARTRSASEDLFERIEAGNRRYLEIWAAHRDIFRNLFQVATIEPRFAKLQQEVRDPFVSRICRNLERGLEEGETRNLDPAIVGWALGGMLDWAAYNWLGLGLVDGPGFTIEAVSRELSEAWYHAVYGGRAHAACTNGARPLALRAAPARAASGAFPGANQLKQ